MAFDPTHPSDAFHGAKLALFVGAELLVYRRDDRPGLAWPGCWDLPGGGREGLESPLDCARRELFEEFGLELSPALVCYERAYGEAPATAWFFAAALPASSLNAVRFGSEGQYWTRMAPQAFLAADDAPPPLQARLRDCLNALRR